MSSDGSKLAAVNYGGSIYTSSDAGVTWTEQTAAAAGLVATAVIVLVAARRKVGLSRS